VGCEVGDELCADLGEQAHGREFRAADPEAAKGQDEKGHGSVGANHVGHDEVTNFP
jgi:hypothetical protein